MYRLASKYNINFNLFVAK
jgi:hypothetical protein